MDRVSKKAFIDNGVEFILNADSGSACGRYWELVDFFEMLVSSGQKLNPIFQGYYGRKFPSGNFEKTIIRKIDSKRGYGCFANETIRKGESLGEYAGEACFFNPSLSARYLFSSEFCKFKDFQKEAERILGLNVSENSGTTVDAYFKGNFSRFINSCPQFYKTVEGLQVVNLFAIPFFKDFFRVGLVASRDIQEGEELRLDYGPSYFFNAGIRENPETFRIERGKIRRVSVVPYLSKFRD